MFVTKTTAKPVRVLTIAKSKKAAIDTLLDEVQELTGALPKEVEYAAFEEMDLALLWKLNATQKKALKAGAGVIIRPLG